MRLKEKIAYIIVALLATILFFLAVGYNGWGCNDSILGPNCIKVKVNEITGALLVTAGLLIFIAAVLLLVVIRRPHWPVEITAGVFAALAAVVSIAGVFYYLDTLGQWSPFIATIAMALSVALATFILTDLIHCH